MKMSEDLMPAWKIIANPDSMEEDWLNAYAKVGDRVPPPTVLASGYYVNADYLAKKTLKSCLESALLTARLGAFILDMFFLGALFTIFQCLATPFDTFAIAASTLSAFLDQLSLLFTLKVLSAMPMSINALLLVLLSWFYHAGLEASPLRATLGELAYGLTVGDKQGKQVSLARATVRHFARALCPLTFCLGYLVPVINMQQRSLEDLVAGTYVTSKEHKQIEENFERLPSAEKQQPYPYGKFR